MIPVVYHHHHYQISVSSRRSSLEIPSMWASGLHLSTISGTVTTTTTTTNNNNNNNNRETLYFIDYLYRTIHTIRIIRKYWSRGIVRLPTIDVRMNKEFEFSPILRHMYLALKMFPLVVGQVIIVIISIVLVVMTFLVLYIPSYYDYTKVCIDGTTNSTFLRYFRILASSLSPSLSPSSLLVTLCIISLITMLLSMVTMPRLRWSLTITQW